MSCSLNVVATGTTSRSSARFRIRFSHPRQKRLGRAVEWLGATLHCQLASLRHTCGGRLEMTSHITIGFSPAPTMRHLSQFVTKGCGDTPHSSGHRKAQTKILEALSWLRQDGGEVFVNGKNLEAIIAKMPRLEDSSIDTEASQEE